MRSRIRFARGNSATRSVSTEVPAEGQPVYETDTKKLYIGDGETPLKDLNAINAVDADNVKSTINRHPITGQNGIFEDDGVTVKNASIANVADLGITILDRESSEAYSVRIVSALPVSPDTHTIYLVKL